MANAKYPSYGPTLSTFKDKNNTLIENDAEIRALMAAHGIQNKRENNLMYNKFSRIHAIDPYNAMTVTREYIFFTKPDLHLFNLKNGKIATSLSNYAFFQDAIDRYKIVCEQLQSSITKISNTETRNRNCPFITLLSNTVTSELELPDIEAENELETGANVFGTKISYRGNSYPSDQEHTFSLEFEDTKYLEVYMFFKIWDEYCRYKNLGLIELNPSDSSDDARWIDYTWRKILHDQIAVYKFVVGEDGSTLTYWAKYTGVYPTNVPRSALSNMNNSDGQKLTVNFKAQFVRDMDPVILGDFNTVALGNNSYNRYGRLPIFNSVYHNFEGSWAEIPYIGQIENRNGETLSPVEKLTKYKLLWKG